MTDGLKRKLEKGYLENSIKLDLVKSISLDSLEEICKAVNDGRCIAFPCKPGDKIFLISKKQGIMNAYVRRFQYNKNGLYIVTKNAVYHINELNKSFFLTKEKALQIWSESCPINQNIESCSTCRFCNAKESED